MLVWAMATPVFLLETSHAQRSLVDYSSQVAKSRRQLSHAMCERQKEESKPRLAEDKQEKNKRHKTVQGRVEQ